MRFLRTLNSRRQESLLLWRHQQVIPELRLCFLGKKELYGREGVWKKEERKEKRRQRGMERDRIIFHTPGKMWFPTLDFYWTVLIGSRQTLRIGQDLRHHFTLSLYFAIEESGVWRVKRIAQTLTMSWGRAKTRKQAFWLTAHCSSRKVSCLLH